MIQQPAKALDDDHYSVRLVTAECETRDPTCKFGCVTNFL